ncbi:MAG: Helicase associated domain protein [Microbacterium gubbeenense]
MHFLHTLGAAHVQDMYATLTAFAPVAYKCPAIVTPDEHVSVRLYFAAASPHLRDRLRREARWLASYEEVFRSCDDPSGVPPRLRSWIKNQRRAKLCDLQLALLEELPRWAWQPRDNAWHKHADELDEFISAHGRAPRIRSVDPAERSLGMWLGRQRRRLGRGQLDSARAKRLSRLLRSM